MLSLIRKAGFTPMALGFTADGLPRHPLMLSYSNRTCSDGEPPMTEKLRAALQELVTLLDIKERYAAARPDSPRHPQWQQYLDDTQGFPDRWIHALANARSAITSPDMEQRAGFVMVPPKDSEQLRLAVRAVKQTLFSGGSSVALPADSWIERAFIAGMLAAAPPIEALGKTTDYCDYRNAMTAAHGTDDVQAIKRQPLTEDALRNLWLDATNRWQNVMSERNPMLRFARSIERAHGIGPIEALEGGKTDLGASGALGASGDGGSHA